jgi:hypothetical protein
MQAQEIIERLGRSVEDEWRAAGFDEARFPAIAARALREHAPAATIGVAELVAWLHEVQPLPDQGALDQQFGEPPPCVYAGRDFYIEALFWVDGTTAVHQHAFSGAFYVLAGSSIHTRWRFEERSRTSSRFLLGEVGFVSTELLGRGALREIHPGDEFIHSLFHLDRPSVTLVVRTDRTPSFDPQYSYVRPHVALDPFHHEPRRALGLGLLDHWLRHDRDQALALAEAWLADADLTTAYHVLDRHFLSTPNDRDGLARLLACAAARHPEARAFPAVFEEKRRQAYIVARRQLVRSPELRFFLALLLNLPGRAEVLQLVGERVPGRDPVDVVVDWVAGLSAIPLAGELGPNPIGFDFGEGELAVLRALLRGHDGDALLAALADVFDDVHEQQDDIFALAQALRDAVLFRPLFQETRP